MPTPEYRCRAEVGDDRRDRLREVADNGGPAQAARARDLLARLDASEGDAMPELADEIDLLHDAYLHDPHLTRQTEPE